MDFEGLTLPRYAIQQALLIFAILASGRMAVEGARLQTPHLTKCNA
jgi:hypothetical protein